MAATKDVDKLSKWTARLLWTIWLLGIAMVCIALQVFFPARLPLHRLPAHMLVLSVGELPVIALLLGGMPARRNPLYRLCLKLTSPGARVAIADFMSLVGFGTFSVFGLVATFGSRNALAFIADTALGGVFLTLYLLRRPVIDAYLVEHGDSHVDEHA